MPCRNLQQTGFQRRIFTAFAGRFRIAAASKGRHSFALRFSRITDVNIAYPPIQNRKAAPSRLTILFDELATIHAFWRAMHLLNGVQA